MLYGIVEFKDKLWNRPQDEALGQLSAKEAGGGLEALENLFFIALLTQEAHVHLSLLQVW